MNRPSVRFSCSILLFIVQAACRCVSENDKATSDALRLSDIKLPDVETHALSKNKIESSHAYEGNRLLHSVYYDTQARIIREVGYNPFHSQVHTYSYSDSRFPVREQVMNDVRPHRSGSNFFYIDRYSKKVHECQIAIQRDTFLKSVTVHQLDRKSRITQSVSFDAEDGGIQNLFYSYKNDLLVFESQSNYGIPGSIAEAGIQEQLTPKRKETFHYFSGIVPESTVDFFYGMNGTCYQRNIKSYDARGIPKKLEIRDPPNRIRAILRFETCGNPFSKK